MQAGSALGVAAAVAGVDNGLLHAASLSQKLWSRVRLQIGGTAEPVEDNAGTWYGWVTRDARLYMAGLKSGAVGVL